MQTGQELKMIAEVQAFSFESGVFSWTSVKQNTIALSTIEAKYVSAAKATTQSIWLRFVLDDFGEMQTNATPLFCDNMSAISIMKNLSSTRKQDI